jgi:hypothetical protein
VRRKSRLKELAIHAVNELGQRQAHAGERAERGLKVRHEKRRRDSLSGNVPHREVERPIVVGVRPEIAVIAAHRARGLVAVVRLPAGRVEHRVGKKGPLDAACKLEVVLERPELLGSEVAQAVTKERIPEQILLGDVFLADETEPVVVRPELGQRGVDLPEQMHQLLVRAGRLDCPREAGAAVFELLSQDVGGRGVHGWDSSRALLDAL